MTGTAIVVMILFCGGIWGALAWAMIRLLKMPKESEE